VLSRNVKTLLILAFSAAGLAVACGALGAHGLKSILDSDRLQIFNKGTFYLLVHALAVIVFLLFNNTSNFRISETAIWIMFTGACIFSFSVYLVSFSNLGHLEFLRYAGMTAPIGGILMIVSWFLIAIQIYKQNIQ
jgi:uncharacterized membrane protein YgdD (TMEM256/DUF423 family)